MKSRRRPDQPTSFTTDWILFWTCTNHQARRIRSFVWVFAGFDLGFLNIHTDHKPNTKTLHVDVPTSVTNNPSNPKLPVANDVQMFAEIPESLGGLHICVRCGKKSPRLDTFGHWGAASVAGGIHLPCVMLRWGIEFVDWRLPSRKR